jgi:hypothetical protein
MGDVCIVIQGPTLYAIEMCLTYSNYPHVIWSTWNSEPEATKNLIRDCGITLIESEPPANRGEGNINMQSISTRVGIDKAISLGFKYVLKIRHDLFFEYKGPESRYNWMDIFKKNGNLTFLCSYYSESGEHYLVDYFCFGPARKMMDFWSYYGTRTDMCAERQMSRWFRRVFPEGETVNFILDDLGEEVDIFWYGRGGVMLSEYKAYPETGDIQP